VSDHPVLIPTSKGAVGGIVSEPDAESRAALIFFPAGGRPARSGINSFLTRMARTLAERGVVVLRVDRAREGETLPIGEGEGGQIWRKEVDLVLLSRVLTWFRERLPGLDLYLAGHCSGGRAAVELAGRSPDAVAGTFPIVPHLRVFQGDSPRFSEAAGEFADREAVDPSMVERYRATLERAPSWILVGEHDTPDISMLKRMLGPTANPLEVEVVPGAALHLLDQPDIQDQTQRRLLARIDAALASGRDDQAPAVKSGVARSPADGTS
jgi:dienelactone hydrolase